MVSLPRFPLKTVFFLLTLTALFRFFSAKLQKTLLILLMDEEPVNLVRARTKRDCRLLPSWSAVSRDEENTMVSDVLMCYPVMCKHYTHYHR